MFHANSLAQLVSTVSAGVRFAEEQTILTGVHYYYYYSLDVTINALLITCNMQQPLLPSLPFVLSNQIHITILTPLQSCTDSTVDVGMLNNLAIETQTCSGVYPQSHCDFRES